MPPPSSRPVGVTVARARGASARISAVCSPIRGAGRRYWIGVRDSDTNGPG